MKPRHLVLAALLVALFGAGFLTGRSPGDSLGTRKNLDSFVEVMDKVEKNYVDPVTEDQLVDGAIAGMLRTSKLCECRVQCACLGLRLEWRHHEFWLSLFSVSMHNL